MPGSRRGPWRSASSPDPQGLRRLLQSHPYPSCSCERRSDRTLSTVNWSGRRHPAPRRTPSPIRSDGLNGGDSSFLQNHRHDTAALDMFVVVTATFRLLYAVVVLGHERRKVIHFDVTPNPTQAWLARQVTEAFPWDTAPRFLLRDRDASYGHTFCDRVDAIAIEEFVTAPRSPWQNAYVERIIGSILREFLDHAIICYDRHL